MLKSCRDGVIGMTVLLIAVLLFPACATQPQPAEPEPTPAAETAPLKAFAQLNPTEGSTVSGTVEFEQSGPMLHVNGKIMGLTPGAHGFHIHEIGDCSAPDGTSAGGHFNPAQAAHGRPDSAEHHAGDLGNLNADQEGTAELHAIVDFISLSEGPNSIVGRAVIVHADPDDFTTQPTGAAGGRLACGVIELR